MRDGLREVSDRADDFEVVGEPADGEAAVRTAEPLKTGVIVMDLIMLPKNGIYACREVAERLPDTRVLIFTAASGEDAVIDPVAVGLMGYLQKYSDKEQLPVPSVTFRVAKTTYPRA